MSDSELDLSRGGSSVIPTDHTLELEEKLAASEKRAEAWKKAACTHLEKIQIAWDYDRIHCGADCSSFDGTEANSEDCNCGVVDLVNGIVFESARKLDEEAGQ